MIDYILPRFHQRHREQLAELVLMAEKVERVHGDKPSCPRGLAKQLNRIRTDLENHMMKEEQILFPLIKQGMGPQAAGPISVMEHEHDEAGEQLEVVKFLTDNVTPPEGACTTASAVHRHRRVHRRSDGAHQHGKQPAVPARAARRIK